MIMGMISWLPIAENARSGLRTDIRWKRAALAIKCHVGSLGYQLHMMVPIMIDPQIPKRLKMSNN